MPIPNDYSGIIRALAVKTSEGNVIWRHEKFGTLDVAFGGSVFSIWAGTDEDSDAPFVGFSLKEEGSRSTMDNWYVSEPDEDLDEMQLLYKAAKRIADGVPSKLKELERLMVAAPVVGKP